MNRTFFTFLLGLLSMPLMAQSLTQKVYEGTIMAKIPLVLTLTQDGSALFGSVVYKKSGIPISVVGSLSDGNMYLHELMPNGDITGIYSMSTEGGGVKGIWMAPKANAKELTITLKEASLQTVPAKPLPSLTGTYTYSFGEESATGELRVQQNGTKLLIALSTVTGGPAYNQAIIDQATLTLKGNKAVYTTNEFGACKILFTFSTNAVRVDHPDDAFDCGFGHRATATGSYIRTSSAKPAFE